MKEKGNSVVSGVCPLSELRCPNGREAASECSMKVNNSFDPILSFSDLCILECAKEQAEKMRNRAVKDC